MVLIENNFRVISQTVWLEVLAVEVWIKAGIDQGCSLAGPANSMLFTAHSCLRSAFHLPRLAQTGGHGRALPRLRSRCGALHIFVASARGIFVLWWSEVDFSRHSQHFVVCFRMCEHSMRVCTNSVSKSFLTLSAGDQDSLARVLANEDRAPGRCKRTCSILLLF